MTPTEIAEAKRIIENCAAIGADAIGLRMIARDAIAEVERLQRIENTVCEQMEKLRAIAEIAEKAVGDKGGVLYIHELKEALKDWRGK